MKTITERQAVKQENDRLFGEFKHKGHHVLGAYCWSCKRRTAAGIPNWGKASHNDAPKNNESGFDGGYVRWQDGSIDSYKDHYREIVTSRTYWDWVEQNGGREPLLANPDVLNESNEDESYD